MTARAGRRVALVALLAAAAAPAAAGALWTAPPPHPDPEAHYLFYLHGRIIEDAGRRPTHAQFGVYEYDAVLRAFVDRGFQVISEARAPGTTAAYADVIAAQVRALVEAGVPQERITVVGFSKGAYLTILVSSRVALPSVRYAVLAGCGEGGFDESEMRMTGRVLSVYETSDELGVSCAPLFAHSPRVGETREVSISTGKRHGAFYEPRAVWLDPVAAWALAGDGSR